MKKIDEKTLLKNIKVCIAYFKASDEGITDEGITFGGKDITDENTLKKAIKTSLKKHKVKGITEKTIDELFESITPEVAARYIAQKVAKEKREAEKKEKIRLQAKIRYLERKIDKINKEQPYKITDEDMDLLIEIENVLCKKSRAIWGIRHKRKIKGGADITPYETGHDKLFKYMELVARIIG